MSRNDLFFLYLKEVNQLDDEPKQKPKKQTKIETFIILVLAISASMITFWAIIQEIIMKLRL